MTQRMSAGQRSAGRVVSGIAVAFLLFDAAAKLAGVPSVVEWHAQLGFPASTVSPIGVLLLVGVVLYVVPRTAVLGAIWLTAYLGGAVRDPRPGRTCGRDEGALSGLRRGIPVGPGSGFKSRGCGRCSSASSSRERSRRPADLFGPRLRHVDRRARPVRLHADAVHVDHLPTEPPGDDEQDQRDER